MGLSPFQALRVAVLSRMGEAQFHLGRGTAPCDGVAISDRPDGLEPIYWSARIAKRAYLACDTIPARRADFHEVMSGRFRSSARRSRSVMPPHTPNSVLLSKASARHCARTGHVLQTAFASCWALPRTNNASGSWPAQLASLAHSSTHGSTVATALMTTTPPWPGASHDYRTDPDRPTGPDHADPPQAQGKTLRAQTPSRHGSFGLFCARHD